MAAPLRTAQQMCDYCEKYHLGSGISKSWDLKHFGLIADSLSPDEYILMVFEGMHNYKSPSQHDGFFAYAVTNKRFILAQKRMVGSVCQSISLNNVNDITYSKRLLKSIITVDTIKETFNVATSNTEAGENIYKYIRLALEKAKGNGQTRTAAPSNMSAELVELKRLLDAGIITQRDFELKKRQILGI